MYDAAIGGSIEADWRWLELQDSTAHKNTIHRERARRSAVQFHLNLTVCLARTLCTQGACATWNARVDAANFYWNCKIIQSSWPISSRILSRDHVDTSFKVRKELRFPSSAEGYAFPSLASRWGGASFSYLRREDFSLGNVVEQLEITLNRTTCIAGRPLPTAVLLRIQTTLSRPSRARSVTETVIKFSRWYWHGQPR